MHTWLLLLSEETVPIQLMEDLSPLHVVCTQNLYQIIQQSCLVSCFFHHIIWVWLQLFDKEIRNGGVSDGHRSKVDTRGDHLGMNSTFPGSPFNLSYAVKACHHLPLHVAAVILSPPRILFSPSSSDAVGNEGCYQAIPLPETAV